MYVNPHFLERELPVLHDTIEAVRFGVLVICAEGPLAAHIPFVLHRDEGARGTLIAHVAHNDPLARHLDGRHETLAMFSAPSAYISPQWCPNGGLPTYNYLAVHAYGRPRAVDDRDAVLAHLESSWTSTSGASRARGRSRPRRRIMSPACSRTSSRSRLRSSPSRASASSARTGRPRTATA